MTATIETTTQKAKMKLELALEITGLSMNALSKKIGVADTTLSRLRKMDNPPEPRASTMALIDQAVTEHILSGSATASQLDIFHENYEPLLSDSPVAGQAIFGDGSEAQAQDLPETKTQKKLSARETLAKFVANRPRQDPQKAETRLDVPLYGTAAGSIVGSMQLEEGPQLRYVSRPPGLRNSANAYALLVTGKSMSPKFEEGDLVFVDPDRKIGVGDTIIIQTKNFNHHSEEPTSAYIKTFRGIMDNTLYSEQINPPAKLEFPLKGKKEGEELVYAYDRVLTMRELFDI
ncbi:S24 family peptidase [uncultured Cohaesibacter sp.]|uniref:S24 family peptidase n=1 Tax=uncultured Cohaesibacter sp. TaxID=1002546 RepID=UPI0029C83E13|nr:S24 family peptidase [uncultured Cohaesibacter sp.]